jgi:hypothetical protein
MSHFEYNDLYRNSFHGSIVTIGRWPGVRFRVERVEGSYAVKLPPPFEDVVTPSDRVLIVLSSDVISPFLMVCARVCAPLGPLGLLALCFFIFLIHGVAQ